MKKRKARARGRPPGGSEEVVGAILHATLELIAVHGYVGLRVDDVATRASVAKTSVYRRWPTKSDLVIAALQALETHVPQEPDMGSLRDDVLSMLRATRARMASRAGAAIVRALIAADDPGVTQIARAIWARSYSTPIPIFERAIERGELPRDTDTALLRELLVAPVLHHIFVLHEHADDAFLARVVTHVLAGARLQ